MKYLLRDPYNDIEETFETLEEATKAGNELIQEHLDDAWSEEVENITISKIYSVATKFDVRLRSECTWDDEEEAWIDKDGEFWPGDFDEICNYKMEPVSENEQ